MTHTSRTHPVRRAMLAILATVAAALALGEFLGWPFLRAPLESALTRSFQRPVRISAPFRVHLLGTVRVSTGGVWIAAPEGFDAPHLVQADGLAVTLRYGDLLRLSESHPLRIAAIDVDRLDARLKRRADGAATWQIGGRTAVQASAPPPQVDALAVRNGTIEFDDVPARTALRALFSTNEGAGQAAPTARATVRGRLRGRTLVGELGAAGFLQLAAQGEDARPVPVSGRVDYGGVHAEFNGSVADLAGGRDLKGRIAARGASLGVLGELFGVLLPTTDPFSLRGTLEKDGELWRARVVDAQVGESAVQGVFTYHARADTPRLEGELRGKRFVLADLAPAFGTRNPDGSRAPPPPGRVIPERDLDLPALKTMDARIAVDLGHVDLGTAFSQPISPLRATLSLHKGRLALSELDANTARGRLRGEIAVDADHRPPQWAANLSWEGIRLEDWIGVARTRAQAARGSGGESTQPPYFTGVFHGRARLTGHGRSTAALLGTLDGELTTGVRDGSISRLLIEIMGLDVAQGLGLALGGDQALPLDCAVADVVARGGRLSPRVALIDTPVTLVLVDGDVDLAREALDLRFTAKPRNVSPFTLRTPVRVAGTFETPRVRPEAGPLATRALAGIALGFVTPFAAILPFVDPGETPGSPCRQALARLGR